MLHKTFFICAASLSIVIPASAQRLVSPEVSADGRVTFRLRAPNVTNVQVRCEGLGAITLQRDDQSAWSVTTAPMEPDIYSYSFVVDGVSMIDPSNPLLKYNLTSSSSLLHVRGPNSLPWEINDVPRGELHRHFYKSKIAGDNRDFIVYTPPGFDPNARKKYPVLYLLHGYTDETTAWTSVGNANVILDNLIARKQAKPMMVVMPLGYGTMQVVKAGGGDRNTLWQTNLTLFRETLFKEVIPQVEKIYPILSGANSHAIAGLSMGGAETLLVGLNAPDRFAWIGSFSAGGINTNYSAQFPGLDGKINRKLRLLWISCGEQDGLLAHNKQFTA